MSQELVWQLAVRWRVLEHRRDFRGPVAGMPAPDGRHLELELGPACGECEEAVDARADLLQRKGEEHAIRPLPFGGDRVRVALEAFTLPVDRAALLACEESRALAVAPVSVAAENKDGRHPTPATRGPAPSRCG